jgi:hypothetical protein
MARSLVCDIISVADTVFYTRMRAREGAGGQRLDHQHNRLRDPVRVSCALGNQIPAARTGNLSRNTIAVLIRPQAGADPYQTPDLFAQRRDRGVGVEPFRIRIHGQYRPGAFTVSVQMPFSRDCPSYQLQFYSNLNSSASLIYT